MIIIIEREFKKNTYKIRFFFEKKEKTIFRVDKNLY